MTSKGRASSSDAYIAASVRCPNCGRVACGCTSPPGSIPVPLAAFAHGDRVRIVADWHPWKGQEGTLIEQPPRRRFPWRVAFTDDRGQLVQAAVTEDEVCHARR